MLTLVAVVLFAGEPTSLFDGETLSGWEWVRQYPIDKNRFRVEEGSIVVEGMLGGWLSTAREYDDFELSLQYRLSDGANSGIFIRAPRDSPRPSYAGMEIQIIDEHSPRYQNPQSKGFELLRPEQKTGAIYDVQAPAKSATRPAGEWNEMTIRCVGPKVDVTINGVPVVSALLTDYPEATRQKHPGLARPSGYIGLSSHNDRIEFRNIRVTDLSGEPAKTRGI